MKNCTVKIVEDRKYFFKIKFKGKLNSLTNFSPLLTHSTSYQSTRFGRVLEKPVGFIRLDNH
jgi:hypothetical protein